MVFILCSFLFVTSTLQYNCRIRFTFCQIYLQKYFYALFLMRLNRVLNRSCGVVLIIHPIHPAITISVYQNNCDVRMLVTSTLPHPLNVVSSPATCLATGPAAFKSVPTPLNCVSPP